MINSNRHNEFLLILSNRWNNAGPACVLWRLSYDVVMAYDQDDIVSQWRYDVVSLAKYGGFVDLFAIPPPANPSTELYGSVITGDADKIRC